MEELAELLTEISAAERPVEHISIGPKTDGGWMISTRRVGSSGYNIEHVDDHDLAAGLAKALRKLPYTKKDTYDLSDVL